jgi:hypothetical protein
LNFQEFLDSLPIGGVFIAFAIAALVAYEVGFRFGRWWQHRTPEEVGGPTGMLVGSLLALMAFLLAITMGMAVDRFDARRGLVLAEANSIGTTYLRAGYLPEPAATRSQELLREYVPLRVAPEGVTVLEPGELEAQLARGSEILDELWAIAEELARETPDSVTLGLYIETLNETIDVYTSRLTAGLYARVPETVVFQLFIGAALALGVMGFNAGLTGRRSPLTAIVMIVVLGAVLTLIVDIDRPQGGSLTVNQQPLTDLAEQIDPPES